MSRWYDVYYEDEWQGAVQSITELIDLIGSIAINLIIKDDKIILEAPANNRGKYDVDLVSGQPARAERLNVD